MSNLNLSIPPQRHGSICPVVSSVYRVIWKKGRRVESIRQPLLTLLADHATRRRDSHSMYQSIIHDK